MTANYVFKCVFWFSSRCLSLALKWSAMGNDAEHIEHLRYAIRQVQFGEADGVFRIIWRSKKAESLSQGILK